MAKRTTMNDIANALGISKNAVSLALRGKGGVSDQLRERVIQTAVEMQYPGISQNVLRGNILALIPRYLGVMTGSLFFHQVCFHMEAYARSRGYQLIISTVSEEEEASLTPPPQLGTIECDGIMTIGNLSLHYCRMIRDLGFRYVMVDQYYDEIEADSVTTTNATGTYLLTRHLIEFGHREIEFFGKRYTTSSLSDRWAGFCKAMDESGLPIRRNSYQDDPFMGKYEEYPVLEHVLETMATLPTAFVCGHDNTAKDIITILDKQGIRCPQDISVVGFDDIQTPEISALQLTTYHTRKAEIARNAVDLFLDGSEHVCRRILIHGKMIQRDSVRQYQTE